MAFKENKLNGFEKHCLRQAVELYLKEVEKQLKEMETSGKQPLYTTTFFPAVFNDIFRKLNIKMEK